MSKSYASHGAMRTDDGDDDNIIIGAVSSTQGFNYRLVTEHIDLL